MKRLLILTTFILSIVNHTAAINLPQATCNESVYKPCICASKSPKDIVYRPKYKACGGKAAAILKGDFANSFSVVLRDRLNRDRFPSSGYNNCTSEEVALGLNKCSAYKCQDVFMQNGAKVCCFGGSGTDRVLSKTTRLTIKLRDVPDDTSDPLVRVCLPLFSPIYKMN